MAGGRLTVFPARRIVTMEPDLPEATAVGVLDGVIAGIGTMADLQPWLDAHEHAVDESLADKVLLPGLIDPHVHPLLPALLTQMPFVAPDDWRLPTGSFPGTRTPDAYIARVRELVAAHDFGAGPFFTWGYHQLFHGELYRQQLDELFGDRPVFLWHRSFHEIITSSAGMAFLGDFDTWPPSRTALAHRWTWIGDASTRVAFRRSSRRSSRCSSLGSWKASRGSARWCMPVA